MSFSARYRTELAGRPATLLAASLTTALALVLLVGEAVAGTSPADDPLVEARPPAAGVAFTAAPGDTVVWTAHARRAAEGCPGLPAEVLVAIGHVETRLGADAGQSSAGAVGPMQFLPATWVAYGTDGDGNGHADIMNPVDAIHGAARFLCANGGAEAHRLRSALWAYNHSGHYVDRVLQVAGLSS